MHLLLGCTQLGVKINRWSINRLVAEVARRLCIIKELLADVQLARLHFTVCIEGQGSGYYELAIRRTLMLLELSAKASLSLATHDDGRHLRVHLSFILTNPGARYLGVEERVRCGIEHPVLEVYGNWRHACALCNLARWQAEGQSRRREELLQLIGVSDRRL